MGAGEGRALNPQPQPPTTKKREERGREKGEGSWGEKEIEGGSQEREGKVGSKEGGDSGSGD